MFLKRLLSRRSTPSSSPRRPSTPTAEPGDATSLLAPAAVVKRASGADLPVEILEAILDYLERRDLVALLRANRHLHILAARRVYARVQLEFYVPFHRIQGLFAQFSMQPEYAGYVKHFLIDIGREMHMPAGGGGRMRLLQEGIVDMFAGGFKHMANLTVLSLPHKLNEAYAALMDLHFPRLERLEIKCDVPVLDFIARHAQTLTHLVYPHHMIDAHELPPLPRLTHLHGAPDMLQHVLRQPLTLRYLGVVSSPGLEPAGQTRVEDDSVNCLPDILAACGAPRAMLLRDPFGFDNIAHALADVPPLPSVTRLELVSSTQDEELVLGLSMVARAFPNVRNLRLASVFPAKALFAHPPRAMCEVLLFHWPHLEVVVADYHYFTRGVRDRDKFLYDKRRLEMPKPWALVTGP